MTETKPLAPVENEPSQTIGPTVETASEAATAEFAIEVPKDVALIDISDLVAVFGILDESGNRLITFYSDADEEMLKEINGAIGGGGKFYAIEYDKKQKGNDQDSARVVSDNFDNMEGYLYNILEDKLIADDTYFFCSTKLISQEGLLATISTGTVVLDKETKMQIEDVKGRGIREGWMIDQYSGGTQVLIVVFEPEGNNLLMSIILKKADEIKSMDYPLISDGQSAWRVDDEGKIDPELFSVLFATATKEGLLFAVSWAGAEGENIFFLLEKKDDLTQLPSEIYRYWSPG